MNNTTKTTSKTKVTKNPTSKVTRSTSTRKTKVKAPMIETNIIPINSNTAPAAPTLEINPAVLINPVDLHPFELKPIIPTEEPKVKTSVKKRGRPAKSVTGISIPDVCEFFADGAESKSLSETHSWNEDMWKRWKPLNKASRDFCYNVYSIEIKALKLLDKVPNEDRETIKNMLKSLIDNH